MARSTRAIIVGAGMAGLVATRVLADLVDEVVVLERDQVDPGRDERAGVPQAAHIHVLLRRGYLELTRLFPDLDARLDAEGAPVLDLLSDGLWITPGGEAPRLRSTFRSRTMSRAALERVIRGLVSGRPNVRFLHGHEVVGLVGDPGAVTGVRYRMRRGVGDDARDDAHATDGSLEAWLVVDASGRGSRLPELLQGVGVVHPTETVIDASLRYATRTYRRPVERPDWLVMLIRDRPPSSTRGGAILTIEDDRWLVTLGGAGERDHPPTDEAGFLEFARTLISPRLHRALATAEPLSPIRGWARTANRWRHLDRMELWPAGLAVLGDAMCALNPVYGQGMSVAAMEGAALRRWLGRPEVVHARAQDVPPPTRALTASVARIARLPWLMATGEDLRVEGVSVEGPLSGRSGPIAKVLGRYLDEVQLLASRDTHALRRFTSVTHLVRPPVTLFDPVLLGKVGVALGRRALARGSGSAGSSPVAGP
jgi:2-polyprenyl-6-methoxyphenol hydroxylase-like FAD-dependent oxidoreductase